MNNSSGLHTLYVNCFNRPGRISFAEGVALIVVKVSLAPDCGMNELSEVYRVCRTGGIGQTPMGNYATRLTQIQQNADVTNSAVCPEWHISKTTVMDNNMNRHIYSQKTLPSGNTIAQPVATGSFQTGTGTFSLRRAHYFNVQHDGAGRKSSLNEERIESVADSEDALI